MEGQTSSQPPPSGNSSSNQDDEEPPKLDLPEQLQKIVPATQLPLTLNRWNTNEEIAAILIAFDRHKEWLLDKPRIRPASGSLLMYNRKKVMFRRDGYCWKKRRDGKTNREDHMKLKVKGVECIYGSYVHSAILPTFHRRCYWLLQNPHVVLVHYLNVPNPPNNPKPSLVPSLSGEMRKKEWTKEELVDQLRPMLASDRQGELNPDQDHKVEETLEAIFQLLVSSQEEGGAKPLGVDAAHRHPCQAAVVAAAAAASSFISQSDVVNLTSTLASHHVESCTLDQHASNPLIKQEMGMVSLQQQQQHGSGMHQLGGCVSTMAHMQVTTNNLPQPHPHHRHQLPQPTATTTAAVVAAIPPQFGEELGLSSQSSGMQGHTAIPTTTVSTSLSQLTLATFSHMHLAAQSSTSSPAPSCPPAVESQITSPACNVVPQKNIIPTSVGFLAGLATPDASSLAQGGPSSGIVHLCPSGLVIKDGGALGSVVAFASAPPAYASSGSQFASVSQVAHPHPHPHPQPLPGPSKDIPLFAANPLTQCGDDHGCEDAQSCADENGISSVDVGGGGGTIGGGGTDVAGLPDAGDNCDTLDGSFSSLPSTDLNLDLFLDLQDLEDCAADLAAATSLSPPHFPPSPSPLGASPACSSSSHMPLATSSPLMAGGSASSGCCHGNNNSNCGGGILSVSTPHTLDVMSGSYLNHTSSPCAQLSSSVSHDNKQTLSSGCSWEPASNCHPQADNGMAHSLNFTSANLAPMVQPVSALKEEGGSTGLDMGSLLLHQTHSVTKGNSNATSTITCLSICDFSPEWAYTQGQAKVLVAGPWCNQTAVYSVVFDGKHVAATLVQPGVLRCFTPDHEAGCVSLQVAEDGIIISNSQVFEFRHHDKPSITQVEQTTTAAPADWFDVNGLQLKQLLLDRLGDLQRRFISGDKSSPPFCSTQNLGMESSEPSLVAHVEQLTKQQWSADHMYPKAGPNGLTLLHLASALGYAKLISALIRWRSCNCSPALEYEVDAHSVDNQACTPLMWACAKGQIDAALTLYHWNGGAVGVCNKDGQLPLALARLRGHSNLATQVEQLEQAHFKTPAPAPAKIRCQNTETPKTALGISDTPSLPMPMSPETVKLEEPDRDSNHCNSQQTQPMQTCQTALSPLPLPPLPPPATGPAKLVRRFSEQVISPSTVSAATHHPLSKRYSVDLLTSDSNTATTAAPPAASSHMRDSTSEPRLPLKSEAEFEGVAVEGARQRVPSLTFDLEPESGQSVKRKVAGSDRTFLSPLERGQLPMDTDEGSVRSDSPFIDVERVSSDEEAEKQDDSKHQMVTLANQIIAAMPERIKLSPAKGDEEDDGCSIRTRSESHSSSAPSQGSPRPSSSSFGDDSGISTPMTDSLAFEEYRYTDFGTPASSLSPDSTCLPSPYSPYSFALDSPPPTTADFTEYFNAPTTYMEKDFSQLTLSDQEQRKLYEAAKVIQNAYRHYRDKQQQQQHQKEIEAAVLIQSYYRRYKQYAYYKKMTHAAVLIQNQFRSYSAQKRKKNPGGSTQGSRRELERLKKGRNQSVIIQQRFRSHYQRKSLDGKEGASSMGVAAGDAPDSSPQSEEVQQLAPEPSPQADSEVITTDVNTS